MSIADQVIELVKHTANESVFVTGKETIRKLSKATRYTELYNVLDYTFQTLEDMYKEMEQLKCTVQENATLKKENETLNIRILKLEEDLETSKKALEAFNGHYVQRELVHSGKKIAYKKQVSLLEVSEMISKGYTITAIAYKFGVSRGLIYRRMKELESIEKKIGK